MVYCKKLEDSKIWVSTPTGEIRGEMGITTFRNDLRAHYLPHSSKYVTPPSLAVVRPWFATIGYSGEIRAKGTLKNSFLPPRWRVEVNFARLIWEDIIHKLNKKTRKKVVPYPSQPSASTPVVDEMHKEELQTAGGSPSLEVTSEEGVNPHLSSGCDASADSIAESHPRKSAPHDSIPQQQDKTKSVGDGSKTTYNNSGTNEESRSDRISRTIKLKYLSNIMKDTKSAFISPDSPEDEPIIVTDKSE
ncbi:hypothetical protein Tco_0538588 [Tanacetum coccineum]